MTNSKDEWDAEVERMPWRYNPEKPNLHGALLQLRSLGFHAEADLIASEVLSVQKTKAKEAEAYILLSAAWPVVVRAGKIDLGDQICEFLES